MSKFGKILKKQVWLICLAIGLVIVLISYSWFGTSPEAAKVPVFLFTQAAPDGKTVEAIVPSSLVTKQGSLEKVMESLPSQSKFNIVRFGQNLGQFDTSALISSNLLGAIAIFKLQVALAANHPIWREPNLTIIPSTQAEKLGGQSYQFTCPSKVQPLILSKSRSLFASLGVDPSRLDQVAIASLVCLDVNQDKQPEILAGLRLDNPNRPTGIDTSAWQQFLARPAIERQEYSLLVILRQPNSQTGKGDWQAESIITHTRALAYIGDSISSYIVFGAQDLNSDQHTELIVQEIGLDNIDAQVISPIINTSDRWQWQNYYQGDRSLNIVQ